MQDIDAKMLLERLLAATKQGRLQWQKGPPNVFLGELGDDGPILSIRQVFRERKSQFAADRYEAIEKFMPDRYSPDRYFIELTTSDGRIRRELLRDSEQWKLIQAILDAGFPTGWGICARNAVKVIKIPLPKSYGVSK